MRFYRGSCRSTGNAMLEYLHVKILALIEEAEVDFTPGLNILTGETGAGKSIIIGSISLALGEKVPKELLREGEDSLVELVFTVDAENEARLRELEITPEDGTVILTRKIVHGHSTARINSETVTASKLKEAASFLIDIHGQHEHQSLLKKSRHLAILDSYLPASFAEEKELYRTHYQKLKALRAELSEASLDEESRKRELSLLTFEAEEIQEASLQSGEDEILEKDYRRLSGGRKILDALGKAQSLVSEGNDNASSLIGRACREVSEAASLDEELSQLAGQLTEIDSLLSDFNHELNGYLKDADFSEEEFQKTEARLSEVNRLKDKYGKTIDEVLQALAEKEARIETLSDLDQFRAKKEAAVSEEEAACASLSQKLHEARLSGAKALCEEIRGSLLDLNFPDVRFEAAISETEDFTENGRDEAEFLIALNPGEPLQPLSKVASGGELSRIMLSLKTVFAHQDKIATMIFDEIDTGISGRTAQAVSEKMHALSKDHQIISITHLPQIAAMADTHFLIEKNVSDNTTVSTIRSLSEEESVEELARLLGGVAVTETVLANAREMKTLAKRGKT